MGTFLARWDVTAVRTFEGGSCILFADFGFALIAESFGLETIDLLRRYQLLPQENESNTGSLYV